MTRTAGMMARLTRRVRSIPRPPSIIPAHSFILKQCWGSVTFWCWSGSGSADPYLRPVLRIRDPVPFWPLDPDPGFGIGLFRIPDPGSRIPNQYFLELSDKLLGKKVLQGADKKLGQFLIQDFNATANHRNCLQHSLESCPSLVWCNVNRPSLAKKYAGRAPNSLIAI